MILFAGEAFFAGGIDQSGFCHQVSIFQESCDNVAQSHVAKPGGGLFAFNCKFWRKMISAVSRLLRNSDTDLKV